MSSKIHTLLLVVCSVVVLLLAFLFWMRPAPIEATVPLVTLEMVREHQAAVEQAAQKRQQAENSRKHNELMARLVACHTNEDCIIVDKDPCGCLNGPESVTAINVEMTVEFSELLEKKFEAATACPSVPSVERECSDTARAVCQEQRCQIIY